MATEPLPRDRGVRSWCMALRCMWLVMLANKTLYNTTISKEWSPKDYCNYYLNLAGYP